MNENIEFSFIGFFLLIGFIIIANLIDRLLSALEKDAINLIYATRYKKLTGF
jgi:hypothetical protein